jgi:hypothetical protein
LAMISALTSSGHRRLPRRRGLQALRHHPP